MTYDAVIKQAVEEGAIRVFRLSDNLGFVYRYKAGTFEARGLYGREGNWQLGKRMVSAKDILQPDMGIKDGWHQVPHLPGQAQPIDSEEAKANPGYAQVELRQCYTCKQYKSTQAFERVEGDPQLARNWECNECYERRMREMAAYRKSGKPRSGDFLDKDTMASPPPPEGQI
ncbi:MAG: hypothetical protein DWG76_02520 [Chloroflexi bacterium]|nr:hypothetical protein [Chloroflexota bacterium]